MNVRDWEELLAVMRPRLASLRVRVYGSGGAPFHHLALASLFGAGVDPIAAERIRGGALEDADVLVMPGGGVRAMSGLLEPLGIDGAQAVRGWVERGGMYVGSCAGSFLPAAVGESFWNDNPQARAMCMVNAQLHNGADSEWAGLTSPGVGTVHVETGRPRHWLARGLPPRFRLVHYNGPMFSAHPGAAPPPERVGGAVLRAVTGVVRFVGASEDFTPGEAFQGGRAAATTLFDSGVAEGAYSAVAGSYGRGSVVLFGSHPEFGLDAVQLGWDDGVRLFGNALAHQAEARVRAAAESGRDAARPEAAVSLGAADAPAAAGAEDGIPIRAALVRAAALAERTAERFSRLAGVDPGPWASLETAASFLGLEPEQLWRQAALDAAAASSATAAYLAGLKPTAVPPRAVEAWLHERAPAEQDYGFVGLLPLLERVAAMLVEAERIMASSAPFALAGPYDAMDRHPYQLATSSYLSAAGVAAAGLLSAVTIGRRLGDPALLPSPRLLAALQ